jgi:hypothetical protein
MELAICEPDPELSALISGGLLLRKDLGSAGAPNHKSIGWAAPGVGDDPAGNGVAIEAWSHAVKDGKRAGVLPYFHWIFPYVKMRQSGDRVIENGLLANTFEGYGLGNSSFQSGIDGRWEFPVAAERPYAYARSEWAPTGLTGFYSWSDGSGPVVFTSAGAKQPTAITISEAETVITGETKEARITFSAAPGIAVGDELYIQNLGTLFNGTRTVSGISGSIVTFINNDITTQNEVTVGSGARITVSNSVTETYPAPTAATSAQIGTGGATFNVPGNVNYNADEAIDNIIASNEN